MFHPYTIGCYGPGSYPENLKATCAPVNGRMCVPQEEEEEEKKDKKEKDGALNLAFGAAATLMVAAPLI
jgi:hypothetical protein